MSSSYLKNLHTNSQQLPEQQLSKESVTEQNSELSVPCQPSPKQLLKEELEFQDEEELETPTKKRKISNYKLFSKCNWGEVRKMLGLRDTLQGDIFPQIEVLDLDVCVDDVMSSWAKRARKTKFPGENEITREDFVMDVLISMPFSQNLRVEPRYTVHDEEFGGPLDVVVYAYTPSRLPVVCVVEAKKCDMNQGRSQLYPQLKICHELALKEEKTGTIQFSEQLLPLICGFSFVMTGNIGLSQNLA